MKQKLLPILLSLLIAFVLWSYVVIVIGPEYQDTFYDVKVDLESVEKALEEDGKMVLLTEEASVTLVLSGNRVDLNKLNSGNIYVTVDASKLTPGKTDYRIDVRYPDNVSSDAFSVEGQYPSAVKLDVAWREDKLVDVVVEYNEDIIPEDYGVLAVEQEFTQVDIYGPEDVINQIAVAKVNLELTEDNKKTGILNQECKLTFCDEQGNPVDCSDVVVKDPEQETITVSLPIYMRKVIPLKVYAIEAGGATVTDNVTISPATITVLGSEEALQDLNEWYLNTEETALNLGTIEAGVLPYEIKNLPEGVINRSGKDTAEVTVKFDNLTPKTFVIDTKGIKINNLPAGLQAEIAEDEIKITIRGTAQTVNAIGASQIVVTIDLANAKVGPVKDVLVQVTISGAPRDVSVVGECKVNVKIQDTVSKTTTQGNTD